MRNYFKLPEVKRTPLPRRCSNSTVALNTAQCLLSLLHTALALFNPGVSDRSLCSAAIQGARYLIHSFSSGALARTPPLREAARLLPAATRASDGKRALGSSGVFFPVEAPSEEQRSQSSTAPVRSLHTPGKAAVPNGDGLGSGASRPQHGGGGAGVAARSPRAAGSDAFGAVRGGGGRCGMGPRARVCGARRGAELCGARRGAPSHHPRGIRESPRAPAGRVLPRVCCSGPSLPCRRSAAGGRPRAGR